jgi:hypothetical protein
MNSHWEGYLKSLGAQKVPETSMPKPYATTSDEKGATGFMDLTPKNPELQARYDAMQGGWQGIDATNKAISKGLFSTDAMPINQKNYGKK